MLALLATALLLGDPSQDVVAYAELCKQELGITAPLPPLDCLAGTEVPVTFGGERLTAATWAAFAAKKTCDHPQWLQFGCYPYDLVQRLDLGPDIEAVLNCRQKFFTPGENGGESVAERRDGYLRASAGERKAKYDFLATFDDLGLILKNRKSGKVCLFGFTGGSFYGGRVPPPDEAAPLPTEALYQALPEPKPPRDVFPEAYWTQAARSVWWTPAAAAGNGCLSCHDMGGFKHTPFIDQAGVVPGNHSLTVPFLPVGAVFQQAAKELREVTTDPVGGSPQLCTQCHRIPAGSATCSTYVDWSTGALPDDLLALMTDAGKAYPQRAWMPLGHAAATAGADAADVGAHVKRLKCCCANPGFLGCRSRKYGPLPADVETSWTPGQGPGSCLE